MVKRITFQQLAQGLEATAKDFEDPREILLDWRIQKARQLDSYWSAIINIPFSPASIGRFSPGRGRPIQIGDRYGVATGTTRRETTRSFSIESSRAQSKLRMGPANNWSKFFDATLRRRQIPQFSQGILPYLFVQDSNRLAQEGADFVVESLESNL